MENRKSNAIDDIYRNFFKWVKGVPVHTPRQMYNALSSKGYYGQEEARKSVCLMAYRHVKRMKYMYLDNIPANELPAKDNYLLIGPTGCGKTYLIELLFKDYLSIPTVIVDITNYSETGYVGQDVLTILTRLFYVSDMNILKTQIGIVCLDEFDKIATTQNRAVFAGAGTTKDVTGLGVQRELLKILEASEVPMPTEFSHSTMQERVFVDTRNISFVACGAFSGFKAISKSRLSTENIGFSRKNIEDLKETVAVKYEQDEVENIANFQEYGFLPELIARFSRIIPFQPLSSEILLKILQCNVIEGFTKEFSLHDIELKIDESVYDFVINQAIKRETGARGLQSTLTRYLESAAFEAFSNPKIKKIFLHSKDNEIMTEVKY